MKNIKHFITLAVWSLFSIYTLLIVAFTNTSLVINHYLNFAFITISLVAFLFNRAIGQMTTLLMLIIGMFGQASFTPSVYGFSINGLEMSWPFLPLIILFLLMNKKDIPTWLNKALGEENKINS